MTVNSTIHLLKNRIIEFNMLNHVCQQPYRLILANTDVTLILLQGILPSFISVLMQRKVKKFNLQCC